MRKWENEKGRGIRLINLGLVLLLVNIMNGAENAREDFMEMVFVKGGTFLMGKAEGFIEERPVHEVILSDYYIGKYEVTQKQFREVMGFDEEYDVGAGDDYPVYNVSWYEAAEFCNRLSDREGLRRCYIISGEENWSDYLRNGQPCLGGQVIGEKRDFTVCDFTADGYRLPTEAEWEFAAKGGNQSRDYKYSGSNWLLLVGWHYWNSNKHPHKAGRLRANELGIYDMSGNLIEWCYDWYGKYYASTQIDPIGGEEHVSRSLRGGTWKYDEVASRTTFRCNGVPVHKFNYFGFRVCRKAEENKAFNHQPHEPHENK